MSGGPAIENPETGTTVPAEPGPAATGATVRSTIARGSRSVNNRRGKTRR